MATMPSPLLQQIWGFTIYDAQSFSEKPKGDALEAMKVDTTILGTPLPPPAFSYTGEIFG